MSVTFQECSVVERTYLSAGHGMEWICLYVRGTGWQRLHGEHKHYHKDEKLPQTLCSMSTLMLTRDVGCKHSIWARLRYNSIPLWTQYRQPCYSKSTYTIISAIMWEPWFVIEHDIYPILPSADGLLLPAVPGYVLRDSHNVVSGSLISSKMFV